MQAARRIAGLGLFVIISCFYTSAFAYQHHHHKQAAALTPHRSPAAVKPSRRPIHTVTVSHHHHHHKSKQYASHKKHHAHKASRTRTAHHSGKRRSYATCTRTVRLADARFSRPSPHNPFGGYVGKLPWTEGANSVAYGGSQLIAVMRSQLGGNPTGWGHNWCGHYLDMVLRQTGHRGGGNLAAAYASYGRPSAARPGAIAVMPHHVGIVMSVGNGYVTLISGNHGHRVGIGKYRMSRIKTFRVPI